ncbi:MAG: threonylcarbamoyl-AMP synthase [Lachnospiraceae bacterium]|nr:threonylcarbamoyl-AMP synthase [Lachnospiraceae bacterium]
MDTKIIKIDEENIDEALISQAGKIIKNGGLVAFPTETVYGLGGDALNRESSKKIYAAKGRPSDNPLIVHIADINDMNAIVLKVKENALKLAERFWPGPLTMILKKSDRVPLETTGGLDSVAIRMPVHKTAAAFIKAAGGYVAAPSANISGKPSPTSAKYVIQDMDGRIDMIIDGGDSGIGLESTIVDLTGDIPVLLRPGYITVEQLREVLGNVDVDKTILDGDCKERPKAPGMKYRHYAPKGELTIVEGQALAVVEKINELTHEAERENKKVCVIATDENADSYEAGVIKSIGSRNDEDIIAHRLYTILRECDDENIDVIYSESFDSAGIGQAIMNRLLKAAGHHMIHI